MAKKDVRQVGVKMLADAALSSFISPAVRDQQRVQIAVQNWAEIMFDQIAGIIEIGK